MIKSIPSVWDETIVLPPSEIGEIAVFARRHGDRWFLASPERSGGQDPPRAPHVPGPGLTARSIVRDRSDDPAAVKIEETTVTQGRDDRHATSEPAGASSPASTQSR